MFSLFPYLRNTISYIPRNQILFRSVSNLVSQSTVTAQDINDEPKWQLVAAACITRAPIICPPLNPTEETFININNKLEVEKSLKSDHELRLEEEKMRLELSNAGEIEISPEEASKQTGIEFEDACRDEIKDFKFAPIVTDNDKTDNKSSLNRALDKALVLSVKQKLGSQYHRVLPQTPWIPGETLKQSCERVIKNICGNRVKVKVYGNAPCGHHKYKYPKEVRKDGYIGAKVFFFSGHVLAYDSEGLEESSDEYSDFQWLTHDDLETNLSKSYFKAVSKFLIPGD